MTRSLATLCGRARAANVRLVLKISRLQAIGVSRMRQKGEFLLRSTELWSAISVSCRNARSPVLELLQGAEQVGGRLTLSTGGQIMQTGRH